MFSVREDGLGDYYYYKATVISVRMLYSYVTALIKL